MYESVLQGALELPLAQKKSLIECLKGAVLDQIHSRSYQGRFEHYVGNLLLVGISYDRDARPGMEGYKHHICRIERA
jgi:hypothetical protein